MITYSSATSQTLEIGIGSNSIPEYFSKEIEATGTGFKEIEFFAGKSDEELCKNCFNNVLINSVANIFPSKQYLAIKPAEDIQITKISFESEAIFSSVPRLFFVLMGGFYIILGFAGLKRTNSELKHE